MIVLSGRVVAHSAERRELFQALLAWTATIRKDADLLAAYVYEDLEVPAAFNVVSEWRTSAALDANLRSDAFGVLIGALKVLARQHRMVVTRPSAGLNGEIGAIYRLEAGAKADA